MPIKGDIYYPLRWWYRAETDHGTFTPYPVPVPAPGAMTQSTILFDAAQIEVIRVADNPDPGKS